MRRIPPHAIDRPALRQLLDSGLDAPLSLVVAPAGSGKSVLLAQWLQSRDDVTGAWFDISADDAAAAAFAARLRETLVALIPDYPAPSAPVDTTDGCLGAPFLEDFAGSLADAGPIVLVFDDLDRLAGSPVLTDLWRLVDLLPPNAHAVFSSRVDLQLGWSRHRVQHGLVELRQRELAFDDETTALVIERIAGHPISDRALAAVAARTEGWAVGVQLTALGLRLSEDPDRIVGTLLETDRLVVEYLSAEVLDALAPARRDALTRLAVLDELCAGLVERVAGVAGGAEFLAELERDSLFILAVPGRRGYFRFHPLFRDLLRYRLRATHPGAETALLEAAADWFLAEGEYERAIDELLRAKSWERALAEILAGGRELLDTARPTTIARWLRRMPPDVRARHVEAELLLALLDERAGHGATAVDELRALLIDERLTVGQRQVALAHLAAGVQFQPHAETFRDAASAALDLLAQDPDAARPDLLGMSGHPVLRFTSRLSRGRAYLCLGDLVAARRELEEAVRLSEFAPTSNHVEALGCLALIDAFRGQLVEATRLSDDALETARESRLLSHPSPAEAYLARAVTAIQRGEPDVGALALAEAAVRAAADQRTQLQWIAYFAGLMIEPVAERAVLAAPHGPPPPLVRRGMTAFEMERARYGGTPTAPPAGATEWSPLAFEEVAALLAEERTIEARALLSRLSFDANLALPVGAVEWELLTGWVWKLEGDLGKAEQRLANALDLAAPQRLVHPFVRAGADVVDLIEPLLDAHPDFARHVVRRIRASSAPRHVELADELTPRELELLAFLPTRMTTADIAARCYVSTNTIKTHLAHIYRKLEVAGRKAAIERAAALGLLDVPDLVATP
ncbi:LuxR C-terminal-related transcriptional regulator [Microbacterium sp. X-17]|uniref:LuxR C-terminal-related transcriptional regulator n=1 Tax=Microbacterium sp. X-17 TaxID=3144404 RepID=UPI0031F5B79D